MSPPFMKWRISRNAVSTVNRIAALRPCGRLVVGALAQQMPRVQNASAGTP
jgi:hypothetical protein